ncbi:MAG: tail fiber protein [Pseudomonadota bacterium]|nr:tail fiber protein [Pseudomonadota bacterium]
MDPLLGSIMLVPYNFAPRGWHDCDGTLLPISQYSALFSLLGTTYGGDGIHTFALPDLRSSVPVGIGQKPGHQFVQLGEAGGSESVTLTASQMPMHAHPLTGTAQVSIHPKASTAAASTPDPTGNVWAAAGDGITSESTFHTPDPSDVDMAAISGNAQLQGMTGTTGGSQPVGIRNPFLGLRYIIAMEGIYPSRS